MYQQFTINVTFCKQNNSQDNSYYKTKWNMQYWTVKMYAIYCCITIVLLMNHDSVSCNICSLNENDSIKNVVPLKSLQPKHNS